MDIAYYPGCTLNSTSKLYDTQTKLVMEKLEIHLHELEDWNCCGATSIRKTDDFLSIALPARNLGIADNMELTEMLIPCSSCYNRMIIGRELLMKDPALREEINQDLEKKVTGKINLLSVVKILDNCLASGILKDKIERELKFLNPVCYYGCLQTRFPIEVPLEDNRENPQAMDRIAAACGAKPIDWNYKTACCGASATINDQELSLDLMGTILKDALAREANCLITSCPMCHFNLDTYQNMILKHANLPKALPIYFITEIVGLALGLSPKDLLIDRHIIESTTLLNEV